METWFGATSVYPFVPFSLSHLLALAIAASGLITLVFAGALLREKKRLFQSLRWALLALLFTSEFSYHYWAITNGFWKFFVHHTAISWACLFLALANPAAIHLRSVFSVYALLLVYAAFIGFCINPLTDSNYLYLMQRPKTASPLDFFGDGMWYYMNLCLTALGLFMVQCLVFKKFIKTS